MKTRLAFFLNIQNDAEDVGSPDTDAQLTTLDGPLLTIQILKVYN